MRATPAPRPPRAKASSKGAKPAPDFLPPLRAHELRDRRGDITDELSTRGCGWCLPGHDHPAILAIDPGATTGWAILTADGTYDGGLIKSAGGVTFAWEQAIADRVEWLVRLEERGEALGCLVVVETAWLGKNVQSMISILEYVGAVLGVATHYELPVWRVQPSEWQGPMLGGRKTRAQGKATSKIVAERKLGVAMRTHDQSDCALLALWARGPY